VLGAIVGGLAAREASEAVSNSHHGGGHHHHHGHGHEKRDDKGALLSTIVGAAVGGLGANAIEKKLEDRRSASREKDWERDRDRREGGRRSEESRRY
jgi:outer membrane lipoprotein SlyB